MLKRRLNGKTSLSMAKIKLSGPKQANLTQVTWISSICNKVFLHFLLYLVPGFLAWLIPRKTYILINLTSMPLMLFFMQKKVSVLCPKGLNTQTPPWLRHCKLYVSLDLHETICELLKKWFVCYFLFAT